MRFSSESGQSTIEAAFLLPILFAVFGLFLQPGLLLYNRCVMNAAATEGCRLIATGGVDDASVRAYIERRLSSIPRLDIFHEGPTWDISWSKESADSPSSVSISNHAKPLPLFGIVAGLSGNVAGDGCIEQRVEATGTVHPQWASQLGSGPDEWIGAWK